MAHVGFTVFDETIDDPGQFVSGGGDGFGCPESGLHATVEAAQGALAPFQRGGGQAQSVAGSVDDATRSTAEHFAAADAIVRTKSQPGTEMFLGGESAHVGPHFGEQHQAGQRPNAFDGGQVDGRFSVQGFAHILTGHLVQRGSSARLAGRDGLAAQVHPVG